MTRLELHTWNSDMYKKGKGSMYVILMAAMLMPSFTLRAQPKAVGASFSFTGISVSYEHSLSNDNAFIETSLKAECCEAFSSRAEYPGISASATWNVILKQWSSSEGNSLRLFAGPGAIIGYGRDFKSKDGLIFGLKGRVGIECEFSRNVTISALISPVIGSHFTFEGNFVSMKYYRNGLQYGLVPEVGIKYSF